MTLHLLLLFAQAAELPQTWVGIAATVVTAFTTIITTLLVRIDNRLAAFDKRFLSLEQTLSDFAQSNLLKIISGDGSASAQQEATKLLATMQRRNHGD